MVDRPRGFIDVIVDPGAAAKGLKRVGRSFFEMSTQINQSLEIIQKALNITRAAWSKVTETVGRYIDLANVQIEAERKLAEGLRLTGDNTEENRERFKAFASQMQAVTTVGDEVTLSLIGQLKAMGVATDQIEDATKASLGLAKAMNIDLRTASKAVGKAFIGDIGALKEYGVVVSDVSEAQSVLLRFFEASRSQAATFEGRVNALAGAWDDYREAVGLNIVRSEELKRSLTAIRVVIERMTLFVADPSTALAFKKFFGVIGDVARPVAGVIGDIATGFRAMAAAAATVLEGGGLGEGLDAMFKSVIADGKAFKDVLADIRKTIADLDAAGEGAQDQGEAGGERRARRRGAAEVKDPIIERLRQQREAFEEERNLLTMRRELHEANAARVGELMIKEAELARRNSELFAAAEESKRQAQADFTASFVTNAAQMLGSGESIGKILLKLAGQFITTIGTQLIQLGTVALVGGKVGTAVPFLATLTGGPVGIAAGTAAIAAGVAMVAAGNAMGGAGGGASRGAASGGGAPAVSSGVTRDSFGGGGRGTTDRLVPDDPRSGGQTITIVQNFNQPVIGNDRRGARALAGILSQRALPVGG